MAKTKLTLTDTHLVILSTASARKQLNLIPLPDRLGQRDDRIEAIIDDLVRHKLAAEQVGVPLDQTWRTIEDQRVGLITTPAGLKAIGVETAGAADALDVEIEVAADDQPSIKPTRTATKTQMVIDLLSRAEGGTLAEIVEATGWLKHTSSAALTCCVIFPRGLDVALSSKITIAVTDFPSSAISSWSPSKPLCAWYGCGGFRMAPCFCWFAAIQEITWNIQPSRCHALPFLSTFIFVSASAPISADDLGGLTFKPSSMSPTCRYCPNATRATRSAKMSISSTTHSEPWQSGSCTIGVTIKVIAYS